MMISLLVKLLDCKRGTQFLCVSVVCLLLAGCESSQAEDVLTGLVGRWDFDDGIGKDLSGNGNDAEFGGARIYSLGKGRACIQLLEDDDPMHIPASEDSVLAISRGTICFWLNAGWNRTTILEYDNNAVQLNQY
ncbi:MAG: hypothetical protein ACYS91_11820, partial [Planctomycetota bacterium]